jgi:hypothetical protein
VRKATRGFLANSTLLLVAIAVSLGILECGSPLLHRAITGRCFDREEALGAVGAAWQFPPAETTVADIGMTYEHVLHPYVGFVGYHSPTQLQGGPHYVNSYGFNGLDPVQKRSAGTLIVGIFGGSVANIMYEVSQNHIIDRFRELYPARQVKLVCGAMAGYKQPQQLMALTYFLALGSEFDVVVSIDGFNEVGLPYQENVLAGVNPYFPRSWNAYARKALDKRTVYKVSEISRIQDHRMNLARLSNSPVLRRSSFAVMALQRFDERASGRLKRLNADIQAILTEERSRDFQVTGPEFNFTSLDQLFDQLVEIWSSSSRQMARLARANGFRYYHFLQPNQYDQGSKVLTENELTRAYLPRHPWRMAGARGYPRLRAAGIALSESGVAFADLSMLFRDVPGDIYADNCCHYNDVGNRMLAVAVMDVITADLKTRGLAEVQRESP